MSFRRSMSMLWSACFLALGATPPALGTPSKQLVVLDLADASAEGEEAAPAGELEVRLLSAIPLVQYTTKWIIERQEIQVLELTGSQAGRAPSSRAAESDCDDLNNAVDALATKNSEATVREALTRMAAVKSKCKASDSLAAAEVAVKSTERQTTLAPKLRRGEKATLTVTRVSQDGLKSTWTRVFNAPKVGRWLTSYGFNFIESRDDSFTARPVEEHPDQFEITKSTRREDFDFRPAVFFSFVPGSWDRGPVSFAMSGGLDFDNDNAAVFLGGSIYIGDNIQVSIGSVMRQVDKLRGEYDEGQILATQVAADQLVSQTYEPALFLGVGFRFDRSPFMAPEKGGGSAGGQATGGTQ